MLLNSQKLELSEDNSESLMFMSIVSSSVSSLGALSISFMESCLGEVFLCLGGLVSFVNLWFLGFMEFCTFFHLFK